MDRVNNTINRGLHIAVILIAFCAVSISFASFIGFQHRHQGNLSDTFNNVSINSAVQHIHGHYRLYNLGEINSSAYINVPSPCNPSSAQSYKQGIYNCRHIRSSHQGLYSSVKNSAAQIESLNWGGYVSTGSNYNYTQGSWTVQAAGPSTNATYSSQWTGIGGFNDSTLIQAGTESDYYSGAAHYTSWFELLPSGEIPVSGFPITPGDKMNVTIKTIPGIANEWNITVYDLSTQQGYYIDVNYVSGRLSSEWVDERPELCTVTCSLANLSKFNNSYYGNDYTGVPNTEFASAGNAIEPLGSLPGLIAITMVSQNGSVTTNLAQPGPITSDGTSFIMSSGQPATTTTTSITTIPTTVPTTSIITTVPTTSVSTTTTVHTTSVTTTVPTTSVTTSVSTTTTIQPTTTVPVQTSSSVPITIKNSQSTATPAPFQQMLTIHSLSYSSQINSGWTNVEFTYGANASDGGTPLEAWVESGASNTANTIVWVNLPSGIAAGASVKIYMNFMSSSVMSKNGPTGEAPTLSSTYGANDNGAKVFSSYDNFAGTSLDSNWTVVSAKSPNKVSINNGLTLTGNGGSATIGSKNTYSRPFAIDSDTSVSSMGVNNYMFVWSQARNQGSGWIYQLLDWDNRGTVTDFSDYYYNGNSWTTLGQAGKYSTNKFYIATQFVGPSNLAGYLNYAQILSSSDNSKSGPGYIGIETTGFGKSFNAITVTSKTQWVRQRAYPPKGIMPSVTIGS